jgi:hypothetical protein
VVLMVRVRMVLLKMLLKVLKVPVQAVREVGKAAVHNLSSSIHAQMPTNTTKHHPMPSLMTPYSACMPCLWHVDR